MFTYLILLFLSCSAFGGAYRAMEMACMVQSQDRIPAVSGGPMHIQIDEPRAQTTPCAAFGKKVLDAFLFLMCCKKTEEERAYLLQDRHHMQAATSCEVEVQDAQAELNKGLLHAVIDNRLSADEVESIIAAGANPYADVAGADDAISPLLFAARSLNVDAVHMEFWSQRILVMLKAFKAQNKLRRRLTNEIDLAPQVHEKIKTILGTFGVRQGACAFDRYGATWGAICAHLGADMRLLRAHVFSLLKKDGSVSQDGARIQLDFGPFERFALACAVHDFVYCLAMTLSNTDIFEIEKFCAEGIFVRSSPDAVQVHVLDATRTLAVLNEDTKSQILRTVELLVKKHSA